MTPLSKEARKRLDEEFKEGADYARDWKEIQALTEKDNDEARRRANRAKAEKKRKREEEDGPFDLEPETDRKLEEVSAAKNKHHYFKWGRVRAMTRDGPESLIRAAMDKYIRDNAALNPPPFLTTESPEEEARKKARGRGEP